MTKDIDVAGLLERSDLKLLRGMVKSQVTREGSLSSFMVRAGLLQDILAEREALTNRLTAMEREVADAVASAVDHYQARNGRRCSIEGDDGEKCWIIPSDAYEALRRLAALSPKDSQDTK